MQFWNVVYDGGAGANGEIVITYTPVALPEPTSFALLAVGELCCRLPSRAKANAAFGRGVVQPGQSGHSFIPFAGVASNDGDAAGSVRKELNNGDQRYQLRKAARN